MVHCSGCAEAPRTHLSSFCFPSQTHTHTHTVCDLTQWHCNHQPACHHVEVTACAPSLSQLSIKYHIGNQPTTVLAWSAFSFFLNDSRDLTLQFPTTVINSCLHNVLNWKVKTRLLRWEVFHLCGNSESYNLFRHAISLETVGSNFPEALAPYSESFFSTCSVDEH